ncbi:hypothetical protein P405_00750 [Streptomyces sp. FR-008]|nr:hypothetical protein P405_00750 [Streptomyces sp. FR-008]
MRSASSWERWATAVPETRLPRSAWADWMIRSASWRACSTICSRSPISSWACAREPGSASRTSSSRASSSARLITQEADMGMDRALPTVSTISSSFFWTSTGCSPISVPCWEVGRTDCTASGRPADTG